jgi:AcrR family transcriptional regulator
MAAIDRRAREQAQIREKILAAARDLFVQHGYESVSMRKIAEAIEYTPPVIYTHFKDKSDLMRELCRRDFASLVDKTVRLRRVRDPIDRILKVGLAYIRFALEHPNHYRLMFMTPPPPDLEPAPEDLANIGDPERDAYAMLTEAAIEAIGQGRLRPEFRDAHLVAQILWAGVHGLASLQITHKSDPWITWRGVERLSRGLCESVLRGMLADPSELGGKGDAP